MYLHIYKPDMWNNFKIYPDQDFSANMKADQH